MRSLSAMATWKSLVTAASFGILAGAASGLLASRAPRPEVDATALGSALVQRTGTPAPGPVGTGQDLPGGSTPSTSVQGQPGQTQMPGAPIGGAPGTGSTGGAPSGAPGGTPGGPDAGTGAGARTSNDGGS